MKYENSWAMPEKEEDATFGAEVYPEEIASFLGSFTQNEYPSPHNWTPDEEDIEDCKEALYHLKAVCQNEHNNDCFRTLYKMLARAAIVNQQLSLQDYDYNEESENEIENSEEEIKTLPADSSIEELAEAACDMADISLEGLETEEGYPNKNKLRYFCNVRFSSGLGEDCYEPIEYDGSVSGLIKAVREYADNFDADDHAELYVNMRGHNGVPNVPIKRLFEDAEGIQETLNDLADAFEKLGAEMIAA